MADTLHRVLVWKGYQVSTNVESRGSRSSGIDVVVQAQDHETVDDLGVVCRLVVAPVQLHGPCRYELWHREQRAATLPDLVNQGVTASDFRLAMLMAGHYQRRRRFWCGDAHGPRFLLDARITHGRIRRIMADLAPLPAVPSYPETRRLLSSSAGEQVLGQIDTALGRNLHTPRAVAALYQALRCADIPRGDRAVLAAVARQLLIP